MTEFNLANAVAVHATYTGSAQSIWGLYTVAAFTAAGFGASMGDNFTIATALVLTAGYSAFAFAHLRVALSNAAARETIADEIIGRLEADAASVTDYPRSVRAALSIASGRRFAYALHAVVDPCVIAVIVATGL